MHRTGAVCHAAEHFDEARDAPFGAVPPQRATRNPTMQAVRGRAHGLCAVCAREEWALLPCKCGGARGRPLRPGRVVYVVWCTLCGDVWVWAAPTCELPRIFETAFNLCNGFEFVSGFSKPRNS